MKAVIMDYPTAWAYVREQHPDPAEHDFNCSWTLTKGALLCDCHIIWDEYARRRLAAAASPPKEDDDELMISYE